MSEISAIDYVERWRAIVERRRAQMDGAYAKHGLQNVDYWGRRAKAYREALHQRTGEDPFLLRVLSDADADTTVIDVGAGTGRHTLALAPRVHSVVAVDPSAAMLGMLREDLSAQRLQNVTVVQAEWMAAEVEPADVVICSHVLYPIGDVVPFVQKLQGAARRRVFVYLRADPLPTDLGLWKHFYGEPLQPQPVHIDLINVLAQIGVFADVQVVEHRFTLTFATLDDAVVQARQALCLRDDDDAATARVRELLQKMLVEWPGGRLGPRVGSARSAIISWAPPGEPAA